MTAPQTDREVWLRGPVPGITPQLQPVAHALLQALEEVERLTVDVGAEELWSSPGGAATLGFHLRHMSGSLDRLFTYARGAALSDSQKGALAAEKERAASVSADDLLRQLRETIERALEQLRSTSPETLDEERRVGRAGYPSTVRGLVYHAGEHTARHAGQAITTLRILRGVRSGGN